VKHLVPLSLLAVLTLLAGCSDDKSCEATGAPQGFDCGKGAVCGVESLVEEILVVTADHA
jgi:hypothetical protein